MSARILALLASTILLARPFSARAGMPAPLPENPEYVLRLNDSVAYRLQAISFFLLVILVSAAVVRWMWNYFQRDFSRLPRLTYGKAIAGVLLWGLLFVVVLTMISGARELMTPGAWQKSRFTYNLASPPAEPNSDWRAKRQAHLERLRTALWHFAALHNGRFPETGEMSEIPADLWLVPGGGGLHYLYRAGGAVRGPATVLVFEPELDPPHRLILRTDSDIAALRSEELVPLLQTRAQP